jgi:hypothetical protein
MSMPIVLDIDGSVGKLPGEWRIALPEQQEALRFSSSLAQMRSFGELLQRRLPQAGAHGTVFTGSGDFHHLSWPLIGRQARHQARHGGPALHVLVFDNHPDNMRFPFGVHCGSWVQRVAALPGVAHVDVVGITSGDIAASHAWENQLAPLRSGKLRCWSVGVDTGWARWLGVAAAFRSFASLDSMVDALVGSLRADPQPTYVSIDKDVFAPEVVRTNWDQGGLQPAQLAAVLSALQGQVLASDVTGEVSAYRYRSAFKRLLSRADAQDINIPAPQLAQWQQGQHALNLWLLAQLEQAQQP